MNWSEDGSSGENHVVFAPGFEAWLAEGNRRQALEDERRAKFAQRTAEMTAVVVAEIQRLAVDGVAPTRESFRRLSRAPIMGVLGRGYTWRELVQLAGCEMAQRGTDPDELV